MAADDLPVGQHGIANASNNVFLGTAVQTGIATVQAKNATLARAREFAMSIVESVRLDTDLRLFAVTRQLEPAHGHYRPPSDREPLVAARQISHSRCSICISATVNLRFLPAGPSASLQIAGVLAWTAACTERQAV